MHYAKYWTMQQKQKMSEDSMWHNCDFILPSDKYIAREK